MWNGFSVKSNKGILLNKIKPIGRGLNLVTELFTVIYRWAKKYDIIHSWNRLWCLHRDRSDSISMFYFHRKINTWKGRCPFSVRNFYLKNVAVQLGRIHIACFVQIFQINTKSTVRWPTFWSQKPEKLEFQDLKKW